MFHNHCWVTSLNVIRPPPIATLHLSLLTVEPSPWMCLMYFIPPPGLTNPNASKSLFNRWLTSEAHPLACLSHKFTTLYGFSPPFFYNPTHASLLRFYHSWFYLLTGVLPPETLHKVLYWFNDGGNVSNSLICVFVPLVLCSHRSGASNFLTCTVLTDGRVRFIMGFIHCSLWGYLDFSDWKRLI